MRPVRLIGGLAFLAALTHAVGAEPLTGEVVVTSRIQVRSGPSDAFYPTSTLVPGDRVTIVTEKDISWLATKPVPTGWLAIKPPRGSFSWVNKRFLTITNDAKMATIHGETAVRVGSSLYGGLPNVEQVKLSPSLGVFVVGKEKTDLDGIWVPITPVPQEVRYIPANAVQAAPPVQTASTTAVPPTPAPVHEAAASAPAPAPAAPADPLWAQAQKAEQDGKRDEAERLYRELAHQTPDHDLRIRCWNRIHFLRQSQVAAAPANTPAPNPAASYYPQQAGSIPTIPAPGYPNQVPPATVPPIRPVSQYTYTPEIPVPTPPQTPQANYTPSPAPAAQAPVKTLKSGILRVASQTVYNQPAFFLDTGEEVYYVTALSGIDLKRYVGIRVSLTGPVDYHPGYRRNHITVQQLIPE